MTWKLSQNSLNNREGVCIELVEVNNLALTISPIDFGIPQYGGLRTAEDQNHLHTTGKSPNCDGYKVLSKHQSGDALDFYAFVDGKASWNPAHLSLVGAAHLQAAIMLDIKIRWGGFFKPYKFRADSGHKRGWDYPHIEVIR